MNSFWEKHNLFYRIFASALIFLHIAAFGPIQEALAFNPKSQSYELNSGTFSQGGTSRQGTLNNKISSDIIGESSIGPAKSQSFLLNSGFISTVQPNPPVQAKPIEIAPWNENESKPNALDLDDYFKSPDGLALSYTFKTISGGSEVEVAIEAATNVVSLKQPQAWSGTKVIRFIATDSENNSTESNEITLQVKGVDNDPILYPIPDVEVTETGTVTLLVKARDLDNDKLTFSYSDKFVETEPACKDGEYWYSEAIWRTDYNSGGNYTITVTVTDPDNRFASQNVNIKVKDFPRAPEIKKINGIEAGPDKPILTMMAKEGEVIVINAEAVDPDNDPIIFYYSGPFDNTGKWLTDYDDSGAYTITVTASDTKLEAKQQVKIIVLNVNQGPEIKSWEIGPTTVFPNDKIRVTFSAFDPDNDQMSFSLQGDGREVKSGNIANNEPYTTEISFAAFGDHNISVIVTDSGSPKLIVTKTQEVDVRNPNELREFINPVMGDFNGDALTDLGLHNSKDGLLEICLSDKGEFKKATNTLSGFGVGQEWWPIGGDFNGDGKTDTGIYNNSSGELQIALSTSAKTTPSFSQPKTLLTAGFASYSWQPFAGNFNGDKFTDFALYNKDTGEVRVALGIDSGFGGFTDWMKSSDIGYIAFSGDFNGDSLSDLCLFKKSSGEFKVAFSNAYDSFVDIKVWISGFAVDKDPLISDFNNDGLTDIGWWDKSSANWFYAVSTGAKFVDKKVWLNFGSATDESAATGDFNGDGLTDAATFDRDKKGIEGWNVKISERKPPDLLSEIDNGIGGRTQFVYDYAAKSDNNSLPFPVYVASKIILKDTLPKEQPEEAYTQEFSYSGGYYDFAEREFRGFAKVRVTDPITNNYTETYFYQGKPGQDGALKGMVQKIEAFVNARRISQAENIYEVRKAGPEERLLGFPALKEQKITVWEENNTSLSTKNTFIYDNIGNLLEQAENKDSPVEIGGQKTTVTTYGPAYSYFPDSESGFNRPQEVSLKDSEGSIVSRKRFVRYDDKGNLLKDELWLYNPLTRDQDWMPTTYTYDYFGNPETTTNALGRTTAIYYEDKFYAYPKKVVNALGQTVEYVYDPRFGVVTNTTDTNGNTSITAYDTFGRIAELKNALGQITTAYTYPDFNTKKTSQLKLTKTEYLDGLGRRYQAVSPGEYENRLRNVVSEVFYNPRGLVGRESLPHYVDESPGQISYIRYEYDTRGRIKKTLSDFPGELKDASSRIDYIDPLYTKTIDPQGHIKGAKKNIYGNILEIIEFISAKDAKDGGYHTYYAYDTQNNLIRTTDNQGNVAEIFYDSLGRKVKMVDPDMGEWLYGYDQVGNLVKQTDAKGEALNFEYDALNRLTGKLANPSASLGAGRQTIVNYIYDEPPRPEPESASAGRLSKVNYPNGATEFFYDKLGREIKSIKTIDGNAYTVERGYDTLDRLVTLTYPDAEVVSYIYDDNTGLLDKVDGRPKVGAATAYIKNISYNAQGQIRAIQYGNGARTTYAYGDDLRISQILTEDPALAKLQDLNYIFDKNGNVTTLTDNIKRNHRAFGYDDLGRLTTAEKAPEPGGGLTTYNYQYDSIGNMTYNRSESGFGLGEMKCGLNAGPHALTSGGAYSYKYDKNGNLIEVVGKDRVLEFDVENRLTKVKEQGKETIFSYDGDGGRVSKLQMANGQLQGSTIYIGSLFEIETDGVAPVPQGGIPLRGERVRKHIFAGSNRICTISSPSVILSQTQSGEESKTISYYHFDHLGSSSVITDATGAKIASYEYAPYGSVVQNTGTDAVKYKFTGRELDNTGLYYYGARYYDQEIGRFVTADTIVQNPYDPQSLNRYAYCRNNPINLIDPTGHFWVQLIWTAIMITVGWALDKYAGAEVDVGGKATVNFDTGPKTSSPDTQSQTTSPGYSKQNTTSSPNASFSNVTSSDTQRQKDYSMQFGMDAPYTGRPKNYHQGYIDYLTEKYDIDTTYMLGNRPFYYNIRYPGMSAGITDRDGLVGIGPSAFGESEGYLAAVIGHEAVHAYDLAFPGIHLTRAMTEIKASQWMLDNAARLGNTPSEVAAFQKYHNVYMEQFWSDWNSPVK